MGRKGKEPDIPLPLVCQTICFTIVGSRSCLGDGEPSLGVAKSRGCGALQSLPRSDISSSKVIKVQVTAGFGLEYVRIGSGLEWVDAGQGERGLSHT